jgi:DNA polymerase III subunit delta'
MPLRPLYGHEAVRARLAGAQQSGRLPQALLLEGPRGIGKQRLALWLAGGLLCEETGGAPCGECRSCRLVENLSHPDLHWIVPLEPSKKSSDPDRQIEAVEAALAEEMASRRERPLYIPPGGMAVHSLAAVRLVLRRASLTPALAKRKVFILGEAERLIPQRANPEAANALLKLLEEPPADTVIVLTTADADSLLPTILSRVVRMRMTTLPTSVVTLFVQHELPDTKDTQSAVTSAAGSIGRLLAGLSRPSGATAGPADAFFDTLRGSAADRYAAALRQGPFQARGGFTDMLDGLLDRLRQQMVQGGGDARRITEAIALVLQAREQAQGNVNPQLLSAVLADDLAESWPS